MTEKSNTNLLPNNSLVGKTIFITGAARRIGALIAMTAAQAGADIILHHNQSIDQARELANNIREMGRSVSIVNADFANLKSVKKLADQVFNKFQIDILINNAAIFDPVSMQETTLDIWQKHIDINLTVPFLLSQAFASHLQVNKKGRIINIVDWHALRPGADHFPYTISKAALASLTNAMAAALAPQISVNAVAFGAILPPSDGTKAEKFLAHVPSGRLATKEEVSQTLLFLMAGPEYITGEIIYLDGGRHLF
jgi:pteridine reductase